MEVNGQLHAPAAIHPPPRKEPTLVPTIYEAGRPVRSYPGLVCVEDLIFTVRKKSFMSYVSKVYTATLSVAQCTQSQMVGSFMNSKGYGRMWL
jgi:hypothetical protein